MEVRGVIEHTGGAVTVYDDFAHHPTAIRTTVDGLRRRLDAENRKSERILAIFEPRSIQHHEAGCHEEPVALVSSKMHLIVSYREEYALYPHFSQKAS